jgi:hypothetical protein
MIKYNNGDKMVEFIGHIVGHTAKDKSTILISDVTLPSEKLDEIKEKLLEHEYVTNVEIQRKNREIDLSLNRSMEECPDCPKILKEYYNSIVDDIK